MALLLGIVVKMGMTEGFDMRLFPLLALEKDSSSAWLIATMQFISWIGGGAQRYVIVALLGLILWRWRGWRYGAAMIGASFFSSIISDLLKSAYGRPRPSLVEHLDHVNNASYPSGHATSAAAVYLLMIWLVPTEQRKYWGPPLVLLFLATGMSRIMLGVHYPTDVIGGWMLGAAFAIAAARWVEIKQGA